MPLDVTYLRRIGGCEGRTVNFADDMKLCMKNELFLLNRENKQHFIVNLGEQIGH